jgi:DNA-directed RNA polymerase I subunit RPA43
MREKLNTTHKLSFCSYVRHFFQHPGQVISVVARALGQMWSSLSDEEKQPYQGRAAAERERVEQAVAAWKAAGGTVPEIGPGGRATAGGKPGGAGGGVSLSSVDMPVARVKKICKLDPEVKNLTKEGLLMVTKAAELVLVKLGKECVKTAQIQNRRKLLPDDLAQVCSVREQFLFLREDIQDLHRHLQRETIETGKQNKAAKDALGAKVAASKPITDFFKSAS